MLVAGADSDAVRTGYKRLAQKWHPNVNPKLDNTCTVRLRLLSDIII